MNDLKTWALRNPALATCLGLAVLGTLVLAFGTDTVGGWVEAIYQDRRN